MKRTALLACAVMLACLLPPARSEQSLRGYEKESGYQYVSLGAYPYDEDGTPRPVLWRVLSADAGQILLLTEYVIDTAQVIVETDRKAIEERSYRRIAGIADSDLAIELKRIGDEMFGGSSLEKALIENKEQGGLFILSSGQFLDPAYGFAATMWNVQKSRFAQGTPYAVGKRGLYRDAATGTSPYWTSTIQDAGGYKMQLVGYNGHLSWGAYTRENVGLRVSVMLDASMVTISAGTGSKEDPFLIEGKPARVSKSAAYAAPSDDGTASMTISFIGDCSIGDSFQHKEAASSYHSTVDREGYAWPFSLVEKYLKTDDLTVANLEAVLTGRTQHLDKKYNLAADPDHVQILLDGGIDAVNTVNNHSLDFRTAGYLDSLAALEAVGIAHFGSLSLKDDSPHDDLAVKEVGNIRVGFIGYSYPQPADGVRLSARIRKLREESGCALVVVSLHWGRETFMKPDAWQTGLAKELIDAGADVVYGHHPHVIQPIQFYRGKPIFYSTGNFTFGTMSNVDPSTGIFQLRYRLEGETPLLSELRVIPCQTQGSPDFRPIELTDEARRQAVFRKLMMGTAQSGLQNLPETFAATGVFKVDNTQTMP